jgi:hypothetical protein
LKILARFYDLLVAKFPCQQLCALQNLFVFHIATQSHSLAVQSLLEMVVVVFTAQHLQLQLTT